jgi:hypothetical protein
VPLGFSSKFSLDLVVKISLPLILIPEVAILVVATLVNVGVALTAILMSLVFSVNVIPEPSVKVLNLRSIPTAFEKTFFPVPKFVIQSSYVIDKDSSTSVKSTASSKKDFKSFSSIK